MAELTEKSTPLAIGLNLLLPGLGYMYMGRVGLGTVAVIIVWLIYYNVPLTWFFYTWTAMNGIMAIDMIILNNKRKQDIARTTMKKCPECAELIQREAKVCRYCGHRFAPPPVT